MQDISKLSCLIHGPGNSSDECKVLGEFGSKYYKIRPNKDRRHEPATKNKFNRHKQNNAIVHHKVGGVILQDKKKLMAEDEAHENTDSEFDENDKYDINNMSLDEKKEKI